MSSKRDIDDEQPHSPSNTQNTDKNSVESDWIEYKKAPKQDPRKNRTFYIFKDDRFQVMRDLRKNTLFTTLYPEHVIEDIDPKYLDMVDVYYPVKTSIRRNID